MIKSLNRKQLPKQKTSEEISKINAQKSTISLHYQCSDVTLIANSFQNNEIITKMTSNDQRLQFEYVFPSHSIFSDVNFLTQPKSSAFAHGSSDFQNFIASTYNNPSQNNHPSTTSLQGGGSSEENSASIIQIRVDNNQHPDDEEFNPSSDGELVNNQCIKCGLDPGSSTELKLHFGAGICYIFLLFSNCEVTILQFEIITYAF